MISLILDGEPPPPAPGLVRWMMRCHAGKRLFDGRSAVSRVARAKDGGYHLEKIRPLNADGLAPRKRRDGSYKWRNRRALDYYAGDDEPGTLLLVHLYCGKIWFRTGIYDPILPVTSDILVAVQANRTFELLVNHLSCMAVGVTTTGAYAAMRDLCGGEAAQ